MTITRFKLGIATIPMTVPWAIVATRLQSFTGDAPDVGARVAGVGNMSRVATLRPQAHDPRTEKTAAHPRIAHGFVSASGEH